MHRAINVGSKRAVQFLLLTFFQRKYVINASNNLRWLISSPIHFLTFGQGIIKNIAFWIKLAALYNLQ